MEYIKYIEFLQLNITCLITRTRVNLSQTSYKQLTFNQQWYRILLFSIQKSQHGKDANTNSYFITPSTWYCILHSWKDYPHPLIPLALLTLSLPLNPSLPPSKSLSFSLYIPLSQITIYKLRTATHPSTRIHSPTQSCVQAIILFFMYKS